MKNKEFLSIGLLRFKYRMGDQIIQTFWKIGSPRKLNWPLFNFHKFENPKRSTPESYKMHWKLTSEEEFGSKKHKIEIQKGGPNNSDILQNCFRAEIRYPLFNLYKFENPQSSTPELYKMHWNLMNDKEFGFKKLLKLKYGREDQIIQTFCKIGSPGN